MKYLALRIQLIALKAQLPLTGRTIVITGGLPPDFAAKPPDPPGHELKEQHKAFVRPSRGRGCGEASEPADPVRSRRTSGLP